MPDRIGDVERKAHHIATMSTLINQLDIMPIPEPDHLWFRREALPAIQHLLPPFMRFHRADINDPLFCDELQDLDIAHAGLDGFQPVKHREIGIVGRDHPAVGIKKGKAILNRLDRMPEPTFGNLDLLIGLIQIGFDALVLVADGLHLGPRLMDLMRQGKRMLTQLAIGGLQFGLFLFQQAFSGQSGAPFFCQFIREAHARAPTCRIVIVPQSGIVVNKRLRPQKIPVQSRSIAKAIP